MMTEAAGGLDLAHRSLAETVVAFTLAAGCVGYVSVWL
jgi:hypothetical protein